MGAVKLQQLKQTAPAEIMNYRNLITCQSIISCLIGLSGLACLFLLSGMANKAHAQWSMGARNMALGKAHTALPSDNWAVFYNPALIDHDNASAGFFAIRHYGLRELEDHAAVVSIPSGAHFRWLKLPIATAAGFHSYGFDLFRETQVRLGISIRIERIQVGFSTSYNHLRVEGYGSHSSPVFDSGILIELTDRLRMGYRISNLFHTGSRSSEINTHPAEMSGGFSWYGLPGILLTADVVKDDLHPLSVRTGAEVRLAENIAIRGGWTTRPFTWSAGAGLQISGFQGNFAVQKHEILGLSPGIDLMFAF